MQYNASRLSLQILGDYGQSMTDEIDMCSEFCTNVSLSPAFLSFTLFSFLCPVLDATRSVHRQLPTAYIKLYQS